LPDGAPAPVVIADSEGADAGDGDLVVNLAQSVPPRFDQFERVAEIIDADEARRRRGRERFRLYRERGIDPATHDMKDDS
jgi:DNA polymerase-3 subunit chi